MLTSFVLFDQTGKSEDICAYDFITISKKHYYYYYYYYFKDEICRSCDSVAYYCLKCGLMHTALLNQYVIEHKFGEAQHLMWVQIIKKINKTM